MGELETNEDSGNLTGVRAAVAASTNPLRTRLLVLLRTAGPVGAAELALRTGEPVQKVRRHLNALCGQGLAEVSEEVRRRGTMKRLYVAARTIVIEEEEDARLSEGDRRRITLGTLRLIFEEARKAASNPRLGMRSDRVVINFPAKVDGRGWRELSDLHTETLERTGRIVEESEARLAAGDGEAIGVVSQQIMLEVPEHAEATDES